MLSLESLAGSLTYVAFFPLAGWLIDRGGGGEGWLAIGAIMLLANGALFWFAIHHKSWRGS